ncbi:M12 family metallopeptidase [Aquimarina sp. 2201CG5-10]|uniref:M12 family metallopeptidase n=1 Tax=Aquimarina callyspongiae TaxID=3098150 RepID=UPI002AB47770|nr:M12 family metallopeptidase [Aquimarina sp. 2201CG5-10]MDY8138116.1 M12 family metallopeptidase [Aquimarina sp. 2201CG5-10]
MKTIYKKIKVIVFLFSICTLGAYAQEGKTTVENPTTRQISLKLPFTGNNVSTVTVAEINGDLIYQGDIIVEQQGRGGAATADDDLKWPGSKVPYVIASGHPKRSDILAAISRLNSSTNVCIVPKTSESDYVEFIYEAGRCGASRIGKKPGGGRQVIKVGNLCGNTQGSTMHEIMHALGFYHEQSRDDRDTYVTINTANITSGHAHNFEKYNQSFWHYFFPEGENIGAYDYGSIMHYGSKAFGKPAPGGGRMTTIVPKRSGVTIGQRSRLSTRDIRSINRLYPTACSSGSSSSSDTASDDDSGGSSLNISYSVSLVPQTTRVSCWAASAAMIVGWRDQISINPEDIARGIGGWRNYFHNGGLPADNVEMFHHWGLTYVHPQSYTVQGFADLLNNGPLWVATNLDNDPHVVVVTGMSGDGTPDGTMLTVQDPWEQGMTRFRSSNRGSTYQKTYREFMLNQENLAHRELSEPTAFYVAY